MSQSEARVLETSAGPGALGEIETALELTWSTYPHVPQTVRMHMGIAAGEIGANIVEHSASGRVVRIWMDVAVSPSVVQVEFTDDGDPVRIDLHAVCMPDENAERGRGLALAQAVLEQLAYRRAECNHWILVSKPFS
ncbi:MAG: ATP-binding protein [Mycobacteriaceae bacterium]